MRPLQNLEEKPFDLPEWVKACQDHLDSSQILNKEKTHLIRMPFFGTVFVGFDEIPDERWKESLTSDLHLTRAPAFKCPRHWNLAKILGTLKIFSSVGDAKRNGWDRVSPEGWTEHKVRVAKMQGILCVVVPTEVVMSQTSWDECDEDSNSTT